jgi:hypothetical protein
MLIIARFLQGAAGAVASSVILGMVIGLFPETGERAKAIGIYSFVGAAGAAIGLLTGGVLTETLSWHWVFLVNVPIGAVTLGVALRVLPADLPAEQDPRRRDFSGAVLITTGLMLAVYTITEAPASGWKSLSTLLFGALSLALIAGFGLRELLARDPLLPLSIFRDRTVRTANLVQFLVVGALFAFQFMVALYLQDVLGFGAAAAGLAFLPITVVIGFFSLVLTPKALLRWGGRAVLITGVTLIGVGMTVLARMPGDGRYAVDVLPAIVLMGAGGGLTLPAVAALGMSAATARDSGLVSGLLNTTQQVGGALGLAVLTSLAAGRADLALAAGSTSAAAVTAGYRLALGIGAGIVIVALVIATVALPRGHADQLTAPEGPGAAPIPRRG